MSAVATNPQTATTEATTAKPRRKGRRLATAALLVGALAIALSACSPEEDLINAINGSRAQVGSRSLVPNPTITFKAAGWSNYMASIGQLVHSNLASNNNLQWRALAENIGVAGSNYSMNDLNNMFLNSPAHRANMLSNTYNYVGVGITVSNGRVWVTEEFMLL